jgi:hypothetical protein
LLASCGSNPPVETEQRAIAVGSAVCEREWRRSYSSLNFKVLDWQARFYNGDRWMVWVDGTDNSRLEVIVAKADGETSACAIYGKFVSKNAN